MADAETALAKALQRATDGNPFPVGTKLGGHSFEEWRAWYDGATEPILAALHDAGWVLTLLAPEVPPRRDGLRQIECPVCASGDIEHKRAEGLDLPPRIVVDARGFYWRDYGDHYSMCPVSEDNEPVKPAAVYLPDDIRATPEPPDSGDAGIDTALLASAIEVQEAGSTHPTPLLTAWSESGGYWLTAREVAERIAAEYNRLRAAAAPAEAGEPSDG